VSLEDQDRIARVSDLFKMPAATRWVCFEPLLYRVMHKGVPIGEGYFESLAGGHYTIDGRGRAIAIDRPAWQPLDWWSRAEIGAGGALDWLRVLRDQRIGAGIPFFFRQ
jgi:hypothetical protein